MQPIDPMPWGNIEVKDHQLTPSAMHTSMCASVVAGPKAVVSWMKSDSEKARRSLRDHADELLRTRWWLDGISQNADTACIADRRDERRVGNEAHSGADEHSQKSITPIWHRAASARLSGSSKL